MDTSMKVYQYIRQIKNANKQAYAIAYTLYIKNGLGHENEPKRPAGLSTMGAQSVRFAIHDIIADRRA